MAFFYALSTLTSSVFDPLKQIQLSKAESPVPIDFMTKNNLSYNSLSFNIKAPAITSEWPPIYFVKLWQAISAPSNKGFVLTGVEKVLSTTSNTPVPLRAFAIFLISKHLSVGLVGVSNQQTFVYGLICFLNSVISLKSDIVTSIPALGDNIFKRYL